MAIAPEAIPRCRTGTAPMMLVLLGDTNKAVPIPASAIRQTMFLTPDSGVKKIRQNKDRHRNAIPAVHSILEPSQSANIPEMGEITSRNKTAQS